ncbi:conserved hypothetical protein [Methylocella tundrae]|uniref:DUF3991 domain-containing protein n=1 Tax=Methylocella tundrae TaxID=227605 RepID=A0A8B6M2X9_METTU|nr:DUF3991 and TOPRIM domain-containing protein [Methylocella tundrae]VTZ48713.1 conserved hypothetical protein [Methylocella tundrae]
MTTYDLEIERLRAEVSCATLLERLPPPWLLDRAESTKNCLKYRRGASEVLIVNHAGRGWWDPQSDARGDVFDLVQHFDPGLNFGQVRKLLRPFAGLSPTFPEAPRRREHDPRELPPAERWALRPRLRPASPGWRYLTQERRLPEYILEAAAAADALREGAYGSPWFAHRDETGRVTHVEIRAPNFRGSLAGGVKTLFRFPGGDPPFSRLVVAEAPIDALSIAAIEQPRPHTLYAATGGGMGPATIEAIERILARMAGVRDVVFCSAADANPAGERYAARHEKLAAKAGVAFARLRPPIEHGDWNDILQQQAKQRNTP